MDASVIASTYAQLQCALVALEANLDRVARDGSRPEETREFCRRASKAVHALRTRVEEGELLIEIPAERMPRA